MADNIAEVIYDELGRALSPMLQRAIRYETSGVFRTATRPTIRVYIQDSEVEWSDHSLDIVCGDDISIIHKKSRYGFGKEVAKISYSEPEMMKIIVRHIGFLYNNRLN